MWMRSLIVGSMLVGCASNTNTEPDAAASDNSPFATDVATPLSAKCGSCHGSSNPAEHLVLSGISAAALKTNLVGVTSREASGVQLVVPGDPDHSYLVIKLLGKQGEVTCGSGCGSKMPMAGSYPAASLTALETWITEGAQ